MGKTIEEKTSNVRLAKTVKSDGKGEVLVKFQVSSERNDSVEIKLQDPLPPEHDIQIQSTEGGEWTISKEEAIFEQLIAPGETINPSYKNTGAGEQEDATHTRAPSLVISAKHSKDAPKADSVTEEKESFTRGASDSVFTFHGPDSTGQATRPIQNNVTENPSSEHQTGNPVDTRKGGDESPGNDTDSKTTSSEANDLVGEFSAPGDEVEVADLISDLSPSTESSSEQPTTESTQSESAIREDVDIASPDDVQTRIQQVEDTFLNEQRDHLPPSLEARVHYLQSRFQDLAAYIDAMEAFIDEYGSGDHVLTALSTDIERVQERLNRLDDEQSVLQTKLEAIDDRLDTLDKREEVVDGEVAALADSTDAIEDVQRTVQEDIEALKAFHETLQTAFE